MSTDDLLTAKTDEAITAWLGTAGSQIFFMQLGFLCYEVGFVNPVWAPSIILKNIEDTFVGILTYLAFTHTLATSSPSLGGLISVPKNIFLIGIGPDQHDEVFIAAVFATTCATIISGAVLERMKNKAYILWCFLVILVNYSFIAHWIWNPEGWLAKLGFMDGAGAIVVHSTGGVAGAVAVMKLGPRRGAVNKDGTLKPVEAAARPIINAIGAFILWYGWFAFNVSSPIAAHLNIGAAVGTTALVTCIAPTCASCCALLLMYWGFAKLSYDNLLGALLAGLVGITGACFTVNVWEAAAIGFFAAPVYFLCGWLVRCKLKLDDPLQIIPIHLCCGLYSCIAEGIFANNTMGYPGLVYAGYKHFGVQVLGVVTVFTFNVITCLALWYVIMEKCAFRKTSIRVSILDTYLGVSLFELNNSTALEEILSCKTSLARQMAHQFHKYTLERFNDEQFDFLMSVNVLQDLIQYVENDKNKTANAIIKIIDSYIKHDAIMCVNVSGTQRSQLLRISEQLKRELSSVEKKTQNKDSLSQTKMPMTGGTNERPEKIDINYGKAKKHLRLQNRRSSCLLNPDLMSDRVFVPAYDEVFKIILPVFSQFLQKFNKKRDTTKDNVGLPFALQNDWLLEWDETLERAHSSSFNLSSLSKAAKRSGSAHKKQDSLLPKAFDRSDVGLISTSQQLELVNREMKTGESTDGDACATVTVNDNRSPSSNASQPAFIIHSPFKTKGKSLTNMDAKAMESAIEAKESNKEREIKEKETESKDKDIIVVIDS